MTTQVTEQQGLSSTNIMTAQMPSEQGDKEVEEVDREKRYNLINLFDTISAESSDKWHKDRVQIFLDLVCCTGRPANIFLGPDGDPDEDHLAFVKKIATADEAGEPAFFRAFALDRLASYNVADCCLQDAVRRMDQVVVICNSVSREERKRRPVLLHDNRTFLVGDALSHLQKNVQSKIESLRKMKNARINPDGSVRPVPVIAGGMCDYCGKSPEEIGANRPFDVCGKCELSYFCSQECLAMAWTKGDHKEVCRKPGEFKEGDCAWTLQGFGQTERGALVKIIDASPTSDGCLLICPRDNSDTTALVQRDRLRRMRPAMWTCLVELAQVEQLELALRVAKVTFKE